ncbi:reverse transcriptase (RNA-dependent DNA polymerase) [Hirsutella rhossiliensis]|uniref:Reverse transcriptase (RNA-dependent DNA polymerase) domain-containing protein n=1 Tax=Hirsutella rhossiliensis TaxID=111463 RepID=A0A9P8MZJ8_9HYPO|nr:reverse transcriptase (RNA-dependent DNA polymerase) domain-containing protein [Hirsutella rhossiliensis]KAH0962007.1 reverse transcriptase (RNA-dependent DNA polymerase) domain-containing protein [Hirsutella rhossiliensis]
MYVIDDLNWDMILGKRWMEDQDVHTHAKEGYLEIGSNGVQSQQFASRSTSPYEGPLSLAFTERDLANDSQGKVVHQAFQRYINSVLQDYLDDFVSAYIDDVLIFSSGSLQDHRDKVGKVLQRLMDAGLQLDINKSEFEVKADVPFRWDGLCEEAFEKLKDLLITAPILHTSIQKGRLSWKRTLQDSPEANYAIHDKELLAILRCLEQWEPELRAVEHFKILTDHKNLRYFYSERRLTERQVRWSEFLSKFQFKLEWRPGRKGGLPDALSTGPGYAGQLLR